MDIKQIKSLVQLMVENDLAHLELREGDTHILLRRGHPPLVAASAPLPAAALPTQANPATQAAPAEPESADQETQEHYIRSPMVGTFYGSSDPESAPFINVGDAVEPDRVVCVVEAMKVFNEIKANVAGRITKVLVKNAQAVEFDEPLFAVTPS